MDQSDSATVFCFLRPLHDIDLSSRTELDHRLRRRADFLIGVKLQAHLRGIGPETECRLVAEGVEEVLLGARTAVIPCL